MGFLYSKRGFLKGRWATIYLGAERLRRYSAADYILNSPLWDQLQSAPGRLCQPFATEHNVAPQLSTNVTQFTLPRWCIALGADRYEPWFNSRLGQE